MSVPTPEQRLRSAFRAIAKVSSPEDTVRVVVSELLAFAEREGVSKRLAVPALMGASEAADLLGMFTTNLKRLSPQLTEITRVSNGRIPVYLQAEVMAAKARRNGRDGES